MDPAKNIFSLILISALTATGCGVPTPTIKVASGFELLGVADGKVIVWPIYPGAGSCEYTFQEALEKCASAGYSILTVETAAQEAVIEPYSLRPGWIDGVDLSTSDEYFSIKTGKPLTYFNWREGKPSPGADENHCIRYAYAGNGESRMSDSPCGQTMQTTVYCEFMA